VPLKNICTTILGITHKTFHFHGIKQTAYLRYVFKSRKLQVHPPLNILTDPDWLNVKFHCFLTGPRVKLLNSLTPLAHINVTLSPLSSPV